jgi:phosphate transport system protein
MQERPHILRAVDSRLQEVVERTLSLAALVEEQYYMLARALTGQEDNLVERVIDQDAKVDKGEIELDDLVVSFIVTLSPVARDLRRVLSTTKAARELERAGDEAANVARRLDEVTGARFPELDNRLAQVACMVAQQLDDACLALVELDTERANQAIAGDRAINQEVRSIHQRTFELSQEINVVFPYVAMGRGLERGGDHAKVVAKLAVIAATGEDLRHARSRNQF